MTAEAINADSLTFKEGIDRACARWRDEPSPGLCHCAAKQHNGKGAKTVLTGKGPVRIEVPRDRDGSFAPRLIPKHERRFTGFDDKIVAMYAREPRRRLLTIGITYKITDTGAPSISSSVLDRSHGRRSGRTRDLGRFPPPKGFSSHKKLGTG